MQRRPAHTRGDRGLIEFALEHVLGTPIVKTEDLVVEIETVHDKAQATGHSDAALSVELKMRVEIVVAERPIPGGAISGDVFGVVGKPHAHRNTAAIIGRADVPCVGRVAHKPRMIGTGEIRSKGGARRSIAVVCRDPETAKRAWKEGEVLQIGSFKTVGPRAASVH